MLSAKRIITIDTNIQDPINSASISPKLLMIQKNVSDESGTISRETYFDHVIFF